MAAGAVAALETLDDGHAVLEGRERCDVPGELGTLERLLPDGIRSTLPAHRNRPGFLKPIVKKEEDEPLRRRDVATCSRSHFL